MVMGFKQWLEQSERNPFDDFFERIKRHVLQNMRVKPGRAGFSFPQSYETFMSFAEPETISMQMPTRPMALAANKYPEPILEAKTRTYAVKKGIGAERALKGSLASLGYTQPPWVNWPTIQAVVSEKFGKIASPLGLLFEIETFLYFIETMGLKDREEEEAVPSVDYFKSLREKHQVQIKQALANPDHQRIAFFATRTHAQDLANDMYKRSKAVLKCSPDAVSFSGGLTSRSDPADISLICSKVMQQLGWSVKYTSRAEIKMADVSDKKAYALLRGRSPKRFTQEMAQAKEQWNELDDFTAWRDPLLDYLEEAANEYFDSPHAPKRFAKLLNTIISRGYKTLPAIRKYTSGMRGGAGWSPAIRKDFNIRQQKLVGKDTATVDVRRTDAQLIIHYRGDSRFGTKIIFHPWTNDDIKIDVSNLTSEQ